MVGQRTGLAQCANRCAVPQPPPIQIWRHYAAQLEDVWHELRMVMDATKMGDMSFLMNGYGRPFTSNGFGNKFRDWCNAAGLPHCAVHGLRKAAAARLAELGCTEQEIMSITGHKTSKEIARYTKAASQKKRAERAVGKMTVNQSPAD